MPKSRVLAGILGIFLGGFGVHRFYLGYTNMGLIQVGSMLAGIVLSFLTCGILSFIPCAISIWGLIEGVLILAKSTIVTDAYGNPLAD